MVGIYGLKGLQAIRKLSGLIELVKRGELMGYFVIKTKLPSLNEVIAKNRANKYMAAQFKRDIETEIGYYIKQALTIGRLKPMGETPCVIYIEWHKKTKKMDVDNIHSSAKFILDALQKCGVIKNDNRKYVKQIYQKIVDDKEEYCKVFLVDVNCVILTIKE
jgi:Holliday junction resolvase RusA-like endonuclease